MKLRLVIVVGYDPAWPTLFETERTAIAKALGDTAIEIHHIGSTSVPGLAAKPIIDLMPVVRQIPLDPVSVAAMEGIGYTYEGESGVRGRAYFDRLEGVGEGVHVHCYVSSDPEIERHLRFRDYLRSHPEDARRYGELKRRLAAQYGTDRAGYTIAKTAFIREIEAAARGR